MRNNYEIPATDEDRRKAVEQWVQERDQVLFAQAVVEVDASAGVVSVTVDPEAAGAQYWALMETFPLKNPAHLFGVPFGHETKHASWLRGDGVVVRVIDVDGRKLGEATGSELNEIARGGRP